MKKILKKTLILCMCLTIILQLSACGAGSECEAVIEKFETACNASDLDGILDCITPSIASPLKMALQITSMVTDTDLSGFFTDIMDAIMESGDVDVDVASLLGTMDLEVTKTKKDGSDRLAYVDITYEVLGAPIDGKGVFEMEKKNDEWYIKGFRFIENN